METNLKHAVWIDVNTGFTLNGKPDRLPDGLSVMYSSLFNIFNCPIGGRSRIFEPEYGSALIYYLQEPMSDSTAASLRMALIQALARWEPRVRVDPSRTFLVPDESIPGYRVQVTFAMIQGPDTSPKSVQFSLSPEAI